MLPAAGIFGIHNHALSLVAELVLLFLAVLYVALLYWTFADARRRISDGILVACAVIVALVPFLGTLVYVIVRPPEYLEDVRERELEIQAAGARLAQLRRHSCPYCDSEVERDYLRCPNCLRKLREPCVACGKPLEPRWPICPYCETETGNEPPLPRRPRRTRRESGQTAVRRPPSTRT